jgi:2-oxoglutarate dehydrogenase E1 component
MPRSAIRTASVFHSKSEALIPLLDQLVAQAAGQGVQEVVLGMAHRGRVNVLVNLLGMPAAEVLDYIAATPEHPERQCDLIYHLGREHTVQTADGPVHLTLATPVPPAERLPRRRGMAHAVAAGRGPVSLHGDAAFAGQGVVMETLMLTQREGYDDLGGSVHVVVNNQVGFTALNPMDARTPRYCTDITRMIDAPAAGERGGPGTGAARGQPGPGLPGPLPCRRGDRSGGYRRGGHSEHDAQAVTRPLLATQAKPDPPRRRCMRPSWPTPAWPALQNWRPVQSCQRMAVAAWQAPAPTPPAAGHAAPSPLNIPPTVTQMQAGCAPHAAGGLLLHPAVQTVRDHWLQAAGVEQAPVDWCLAENPAYASPLNAGVPVRCRAWTSSVAPSCTGMRSGTTRRWRTATCRCGSWSGRRPST